MKANPLVKEVIEGLGGYKSAAKSLEVSEHTIKIWPYRGCVPKKYWKSIQEKLPSVTIEQLTGWQ